MSCTVKISGKNQIVIPKEARQKLRLVPGQELMVLCKEDRMVLMPRPRNFVKETRGLHKEVWSDVDIEAYIREERDSWEE